MSTKILAYLVLALTCIGVACSQSGAPSPTLDAMADAVATHVATTTGQPLCGDDVCPDPGAVQRPAVKAALDSRTPAQIAAAACRRSDGSWACKGVPQPLMASGGNATAAQCGPACTVANWYLDPQNGTTCASDANSCTSATCAGAGVGPCVTFAQIVSRLGSSIPQYPFGQSVKVNMLSAQTAGQDGIFFEPAMSGGGQAIMDLTAARVPVGSPFLLGAGTAAKVRGAPGSLTLADMTVGPGGILKNMLVVNTSKGSQALIDSFAGVTATMQQPCTTASLITTAAVPGLPIEDDTWASGDTVQIYSLANVNLKRWWPKGADLTAGGQPSGGWTFYASIADSSGNGGSAYQLWSEGAVNVLTSSVVNTRLDVGSQGARGNFVYVQGSSMVRLVFNVTSGANFSAGGLASGATIDAHVIFNTDVILHGTIAAQTGETTLANSFCDGTLQGFGGHIYLGSGAFIWGSYAVNMTAGSIVENDGNAASWSLNALLTTGAITFGSVGTGTSYTAGTGIWASAIALTPAALAAAPGGSLQDPLSGARFCLAQ